MFEAIKHDLIHSLSGSHFQHKVSLNFFRVLKSFFVKEFKAIFMYRVYNYTDRKGLSLITFLLYEYSKRRYSVDISPRAKIQGGVRIAHCSDIVIGPNASIGYGTVIFNGVTMGKKYPGAKGGMPQVGMNVTLGTGAKLLGSITIGNNARIGANSVVIHDVPESSTAMGIPAKVKVKKDEGNL
jgi:serine O-acetyltransferase